MNQNLTLTLQKFFETFINWSNTETKSWPKYLHNIMEKLIVVQKMMNSVFGAIRGSVGYKIISFTVRMQFCWVICNMTNSTKLLWVIVHLRQNLPKFQFLCVYKIAKNKSTLTFCFGCKSIEQSLLGVLSQLKFEATFVCRGHQEKKMTFTPISLQRFSSTENYSCLNRMGKVVMLTLNKNLLQNAMTFKTPITSSRVWRENTASLLIWLLLLTVLVECTKSPCAHPGSPGQSSAEVHPQLLTPFSVHLHHSHSCSISPHHIISLKQPCQF